MFVDKNHFKPHALALVMATLFMSPVVAWADTTSMANTQAKDLTELSLEELLNVQVTSVMKSSTRLSDAPAAIYVLSSEDIRRSGATSIPEALRNVPGMHVARIDGNKWAVTARGFSGQFANKLLVLVDGRSVYTPLYAGVWWDQQDVIMQDIERIEVIRGPGATLWGANAVNGVINIITRNAKDSQGAMVSAYAGDERMGASLRYGTKMGDDAYLKVYGRHSRQDESHPLAPGMEGNDEAHLNKLGFRFDKNFSAQDKLMLQGEVFRADSGGADRVFANLTASQTPVLAPPYNSFRTTEQVGHGHHLLGRWERKLEKDADLSLQVYWDHHERIADEFDTVSKVDTLDFDFQHSFHPTPGQQVVWGLGYRRNQGDTHGGTLLELTPAKRTDDIYSLFVQDDITLVPERLKLTLGSKFEHNPSSGLEVQPNARLLWTPDDSQSFWALVSRAVRTPNWIEQNLRYSYVTVPPATPPNLSPFPMLIVNSGSTSMDSEKLMAYELGWRGLITPRVSVDVALFYFDYDKAVTIAPGAPQLAGTFPSLFLRLPMEFGNLAEARTYGGELSVNWQVSDQWKLRANYSYFESEFNLKNNAPANTGISFEHSYPRHQLMLWSQHQLSSNLSLDLNVRYVDDVKMEQAPGDYTALDARLAWKPRKDLEVALVGRNLLDGGHYEIGFDQFSVQTENPREVFATLRVEF